MNEYREIIKKYKENGEKFIDPYFINEIDASDITWKRLEEYYSNFLENISENGVCQHHSRDCFLISLLTVLGNYPDIVKSLFVEPCIESGCVCVKFTYMDKPLYIIIDTFVPFSDQNKPMFARPTNETDSCWHCLIEKAYAKLMGGWEKIGGNSGDAMNVMFSCYAKTEKLKQLKKKSYERLADFLHETNIVFAAITTNTKCETVGLETNHGYAVMGIDSVNGEQLIHLRNPHSYSNYNGPYCDSSNKWKKGQKEKINFNEENGHFWIPSSVFDMYFESIAYAIPLKSGWVSKSFEFDIEPGEYDGRFFAGNGPYVGCLPQWSVTFHKKTEFHIYCVAASDSKNVLGLAMCQNNGDKIEYKKVDEVPIKYAMDGSEIIDTCQATVVDKPYTICVSRKTPAENPVHIYCRIEAPSDFDLSEITIPDFSSLNHVEAKGTLNPGPKDGRSKFGNSSLDPVPQWQLKMSKPGRLYIVARKEKSQTQHTFFIAMKDDPGKYSKGGNFYQSILIAPDYTSEQDFVDINSTKQYICVGMTREKAAKSTNFSFDIYSSSSLKLEEITKTTAQIHSDERDGIIEFADMEIPEMPMVPRRKPAPKPFYMPEPKPAPKQEHKPAPKPVQKPAPKPANKPMTKPATKPTTNQNTKQTNLAAQVATKAIAKPKMHRKGGGIADLYRMMEDL